MDDPILRSDAFRCFKSRQRLPQDATAPRNTIDKKNVFIYSFREQKKHAFRLKILVY